MPRNVPQDGLPWPVTDGFAPAGPSVHHSHTRAPGSGHSSLFSQRAVSPAVPESLALSSVVPPDPAQDSGRVPSEAPPPQVTNHLRSGAPYPWLTVLPRLLPPGTWDCSISCPGPASAGPPHPVLSTPYPHCQSRSQVSEGPLGVREFVPNPKAGFLAASGPTALEPAHHSKEQEQPGEPSAAAPLPLPCPSQLPSPWSHPCCTPGAWPCPCMMNIEVYESGGLPPEVVRRQNTVLPVVGQVQLLWEQRLLRLGELLLGPRGGRGTGPVPPRAGRKTSQPRNAISWGWK